MTDLSEHLIFCWNHPDDRTAARALVDHYRDTHNVEWWEAAREVTRLRRNDRRRKELDEARRFFKEGHPARDAIAACVRAHIDHVQGWLATVVIIDGRKPPELHLPENPLLHEELGAGIITVGARYVLRLGMMWRASQFIKCPQLYKSVILSELFTR